MKKVFPDLPGWTFEMDEVSAEVYGVIATDELGREVSATGLDLDALLEKCRRGALEISRDVKRRQH